MSMFTENPTPPVVALLMASACCFVALRARGEGKFLIWGLTTLTLAGTVLAFEWFWVTDKERIEGVVRDLRRALLVSDAQGILAHLTPNAHLVQSGSTMTPEATRALIVANVSAARFDTVRIRELQASAGGQTRRGKADFKVFVRGSIQGPAGFGGFTGAADTAWSLGFEETRPGVWRINRVTPISTPLSMALFAGGAGLRDAPTAPIPGMTPTPPGELGRTRGRGDLRLTRKALVRERERERERQRGLDVVPPSR